MQGKRTGDLKLIQELNRNIILNMIREYGPISRSEIAKRKKISPTTVASAVKELIQEGLVCEDGTGASNGGRRPTMLRLSSENRFLIGVSITNFHIIVAEITLEASIRRSKKFAFSEAYIQNGKIVGLLLDTIRIFIDGITYMNRCIGISVVVPGIVDSARGIVYYNSKLKLTNIALKETIEACFDIKTWIENDMNAIVWAEKKYGRYSKFQNLLYVYVGGGVGAGIVVNDMILRGSRGGAGEFGHTIVTKDGIRCECGNTGCLENYVSWPAIRCRLIAEAEHDPDTSLRDLTEGDLFALTPVHFSTALRNKDRLALRVMEEISSLLGAGIVNMVNLFNPDVVILGGNVMYGNDPMMESIQAYIKQHALPFSIQEMEICSGSLGEDAELIGAASILLQDVFQFSLG